MDPQPTDATLAWFYANVYRTIYGPHIDDPAAMFASKAWKGRFVESALQRANIELATGPIVDLGCGGGWVLEYLSRLERPMLGYDYDERLLALGRERGLELRCGGTREATNDTVRAELLILAHVLEHTKDPVESPCRGRGKLYAEIGAWSQGDVAKVHRSHPILARRTRGSGSVSGVGRAVRPRKRLR